MFFLKNCMLMFKEKMYIIKFTLSEAYNGMIQFTQKFAQLSSQ